MPISDKFVPAVPYLHLADDGDHWLSGSRCGRCGTVLLGQRMACPACGARNAATDVRLAAHGALHSWSIVYRSYPGIPTPFISAVVDLDGGGSIKGLLLEVTPDPAAIRAGQRVDIVYRDTGQVDAEGRHFLSYYFVPAEGAAG